MTATPAMRHGSSELTQLGTMWLYWCNRLSKALAEDRGAEVIRARQDLDKLAARAEASGITNLPRPSDEVIDDPVFEGMEGLWMGPPPAHTSDVAAPRHYWSGTNKGSTEVTGRVETFTPMVQLPKALLQVSERQANQQREFKYQPTRHMNKECNTMSPLGKKQVQVAPVTEAATQAASAVAPAQANAPTITKAEQLKAMKKAKAATQATDPTMPKQTVVKTKKAKVLTPCLDGCGLEVAGNFAPGHDAKLKSTLLKIERGELDLDSIPEPAQAWVKFSKPVTTKEEHFAPVVDQAGNPVMDAKTGQQKQVKQVVTTLNRQCLQAPVRFQGRDDVAYVNPKESGQGSAAA